jgi:hypothetical protein
MVVYPDGIIYSGIVVKDIPEIIDSLREGGEPVERLILRPGEGVLRIGDRANGGREVAFDRSVIQRIRHRPSFASAERSHSPASGKP